MACVETCFEIFITFSTVVLDFSPLMVACKQGLMFMVEKRKSSRDGSMVGDYFMGSWQYNSITDYRNCQ